MITKFKQFFENKKEEKEKLLDKEEKKYLKKSEIKKLTDKQRRTLLAKRKYHGAMNDADLPNNNLPINPTLSGTTHF